MPPQQLGKIFLTPLPNGSKLDLGSQVYGHQFALSKLGLKQLTKDHQMKNLSILKNTVSNAYGRVGVPILLYFLGVPGALVILLWLFFFRGR